MAEAVEVAPWVADDDSRAQAEDRLGFLAGRTVNAVRYIEIESNEPGWSARGFDSVDYGIELDLDDGSTWSITWEQGGRNEGIGVRNEPLVPARLLPDAKTSVWDVTSRWTGAVGRLISGHNASWQRTEFGPAHLAATGEQVSGASVSDLCLVALALVLDRAQVVIALGGAEPDGSFTAWARDNLGVFFSLDAARAVGVPTPGDADW